MRPPPAVFLVSALLLSVFMISDQSFWIDEGSTGLFARQPDLGSWWRYLNVNDSSEAQMPLSLFLTWFFARWTTTGEWQLRAINLLWAALTLVAASLVGRRLRIPWLPLLFAIQAYFWYYTGEARSYSLQIALGAWLLLALTMFIQERGNGLRWAVIFTVATLILSCTTMLAPLTLVPVGLVAGTIAVRERWKISRSALLVIGAGAMLSVPLGIYYLHTLARGAAGTMIWAVDAKYLPYVVYELAGFTGLGPAVADLREIAHSIQTHGSLLDYREQFIGCAVFAAALGALAFLGRGAFRRNRESKTPVAILCVLLLGAVLFFGVALASQKALWARHFAPLFPFYVACLGLLLAAIGTTRSRWVTVSVAALACGLSLYSCLAIRFTARHRKDDYRSAAAFAKQALGAGQTVWWVAGPEAAEYYGVPLVYEQSMPGLVFCPVAHTGLPRTKGLRHDLTREPVPNWIVSSKPDAYDPFGEVGAVCKAYNLHVAARFKGFAIWSSSKSDENQ